MVFDFDPWAHAEDKNPNFKNIIPLYNWDYNHLSGIFPYTIRVGDMWEGSFFQIVTKGNY